MNFHFFAYLSKMRWVFRWGMKRNAIPENVMEHSFEVAVIAHGLAVIGNRLFGKDFKPEQVATVALFHDASESLTGDLPSPIKYHNSMIRDAYKGVERVAEKEMLATLPPPLQQDYEPLLMHEQHDPAVSKLVKAADLLASLVKCKAEVNAGNREFAKALVEVESRVAKLNSPEVDYFCEHFLSSFDLTLDELIAPNALKLGE